MIEPNAPAVEHNLQWWTFADIDRVQTALRAEFDCAGLPAGGRVGLLLRNRPAPFAAILAGVIGERCLVVINPMLPPERLADDIKAQKVAMLIGTADELDTPGILDLAADQRCPFLVLPDRPIEPLRYANEWKRAPEASLRTSDPSVLVEMLTSGTTGNPKRIALGRASFGESLASSSVYEKGGMVGGKVVLSAGVRVLPAPLSHIGGLTVALMTIAGGRRLCLMEKFTVDAWVAAVGRHQAKVASLPPAAIRMVLNANVPRESLSSLIALRCGTAPLSPDIEDEFYARYQIPILQQYGATEFAGSVAGWSISDFNKNREYKRGSVGRLHAGIEGRIIDPDTGADLPLGSDGLLELRGNQLGDSQQWKRTTDRARLDAEGFLWILGRADNAINRGGFKIHPDEIENALHLHPAVREAVVVAVADARLGEAPAAAVVLKSGNVALTPADIATYLRGKLLAYQIPAHIIFMSEIPRTPAMKPSRVDVRRMIETALENPA